MSNFLRTLRLEQNVSQEYLADKIGLSRTTYINLEKGAREMHVSEAKKLSKFFGLSLEDFIEERLSKSPKIKLEKTSNKAKQKKEIRLSVPQNRVTKFKEVILYILEQIGAKPNIGEAVICKILYFIDFDYYEKFEEQLIGATYIKNHHGPTPREFTTIITEMEKDQELARVFKKYFQYHQKKYLPLRSANLSIFSAQEKKLIDDEITRFKDFNAKKIEDYSHKDVPWITAKELQPINYESVFYRTPEFSVREYSEEEGNET